MTESTDLSLALAALKEKNNTSINSEDNSSFPFWASLMIYVKAARCKSSIFYAFEDYEEYIDTVKLLFKWLTPIQVESAGNYMDKYSEHDLLGNFVTIEVIPEVLNIYPEIVIGTLIEEVLPRINNAPTPEEMYYERP